jgi:hypothetical protein
MQKGRYHQDRSMVSRGIIPAELNNNYCIEQQSH